MTTSIMEGIGKVRERKGEMEREKMIRKKAQERTTEKATERIWWEETMVRNRRWAL